MRRTFAIVVAAAVVGGLAGASIGLAFDGRSGSGPTAVAVAPTPTARPTGSTGGTLSPEAIYRDTAPGVVVITDTRTETVPPTFFTPSQKQEVGALGSGFVVDRRGDILTNDHVVQGAKDIRVGFSTGSSYAASIVGADATTDIAVIRVKAPPSALHPLGLADSAKVVVGDRVYGIGNPFGLERTMTAGIVSATHRDIQSPNGRSIPDAIQTDAAINHGNSGGPLLDRFGHVIGVNSQIEGGTVNANVGVGFAVASDTARSVAQQLLASGHAVHPWLGIQYEPIDPMIARVVRGLPSQRVMVVRVVKGSPAAKAGLRGATRRVTVDGATALVGGDAIVAVDGKALGATELSDVVEGHKPGDRLQVEVVRAGARRTVQVTLGNAPA